MRTIDFLNFNAILISEDDMKPNKIISIILLLLIPLLLEDYFKTNVVFFRFVATVDLAGWIVFIIYLIRRIYFSKSRGTA